MKKSLFPEIIVFLVEVREDMGEKGMTVRPGQRGRCV
jgi:hypothetical protein